MSLIAGASFALDTPEDRYIETVTLTPLMVPGTLRRHEHSFWLRSSLNGDAALDADVELDFHQSTMTRMRIQPNCPMDKDVKCFMRWVSARAELSQRFGRPSLELHQCATIWWSETVVSVAWDEGEIVLMPRRKEAIDDLLQTFSLSSQCNASRKVWQGIRTLAEEHDPERPN